MNNSIIEQTAYNLSTSAGYKTKLLDADKRLSVINKFMEPFGKSHSQFMDTLFVASHLTPIRNLRQLLAEIEQVKIAIQDNLTRLRKEGDPVAGEKARIYLQGAIRRLSSLMDAFNNIQNNLSVEMTEDSFEREEIKFHIMTAFSQAVRAFHARGCVSEGVLEYLDQLGLNLKSAMKDVEKFIAEETELDVGRSEYISFLGRMVEKYSVAVNKELERRGLKSWYSEENLHESIN